MKHDTTFHDAIHVALRELTQIVERVAHTTQEAATCIARHEQNLAIGTIVGVDDALDQAMSLYKAIIAMHRIKR